MNEKQYEKTKASAIHWQDLARQAYIDGDMVKQKIYHEYMAHDMIFMVTIEEGDQTETIPYIRHWNSQIMSESMVPISPHQTVQKTHYAHVKKTGSTSFDPQELPPSGDTA